MTCAHNVANRGYHTARASRLRLRARTHHPYASTPGVLGLAMIIGAIFLSGIARAIDPDPVPPPNLAPVIVDFVGTNGATEWTFTGRVIDENPAGLAVTFGGLLSGHQTTVQDAGGYFSYTTQVEGPGMVTAHTIDDHQQGSSYAVYNVQ